MTNKEALVKGVLSGFSIDDFQAEKVLLDAEMDKDADYDPSNEEAIDLCAIKILSTHCVSSVKEGSFSVSYSMEQINSLVSSLSNKWGLTNPLKPTIKGSSAW